MRIPDEIDSAKKRRVSAKHTLHKQGKNAEKWENARKNSKNRKYLGKMERTRARERWYFYQRFFSVTPAGCHLSQRFVRRVAACWGLLPAYPNVCGAAF